VLSLQRQDASIDSFTGVVHDPHGDSDGQAASSDAPRELTYVDIHTLLASAKLLGFGADFEGHGLPQ